MSDSVEEKTSEESLGAYLKRMREARGLSLEDLSQKTRVALAYLQKIEADDWKNFPVEAYVRAYLNSISEALNLDAAKILADYSKAAGSSYSRDYSAPAGSATDPLSASFEKRPSGNGTKIAAFVVVILAAAILVGMYFLKNADIVPSPMPEKIPQDAALPPEDTSAFESEVPDGAENVPPESLQIAKDTVAAPDTLAKASPKKDSSKVSSATTFIKSSDSRMSSSSVNSVSEMPGKIRFSIAGNDSAVSWVGLYRSLNDMKVLKEANLSTAKSWLTYSYDDTLCVVIGNPAAIGQFFINGKTAEVPIHKGYASRFCISPDGKMARRNR